MSIRVSYKSLLQPIFVLLTLVSAGFAAAPAANARLTVETNSTLGTIRGIVRDDSGSPIADASVGIFYSGTSKLLKQVSSSSDGSFLAKILPGTYTVLAVAQGFNPVTLFGVQVARSADLTYGFKLERAGNGNTLPEKRLDRNSSKWRIRAAQMQRSIYQHRKGAAPIIDQTSTTAEEDPEPKTPDKRQTVVETYFAGAQHGTYGGIDFATFVPIGRNAQIIVAGQTGVGPDAPQRLQTDLTVRANQDHQLRLNTGVGLLGTIGSGHDEKALGQFSFQATDEWKVRDGMILVYGLDYTTFMGAGSDSSISPRLGLQFDVDPRTRVTAAYTTQTENKSWAHALELEGQSIAFAEPISVRDLVISNNRPQLNKSRRLEFGVERVLDNRSSVEANVFFDDILSRGIRLDAISFDGLQGENLAQFVADQQGSARGVRVVYTRRMAGPFSASAGYSFGNGQKLSTSNVVDPSKIFESDFFQSFFGQVTADLSSGTSVKTIFRLSPQATVFAIDPFRGRLAIYDPGLSILVTQALPNLGLPFRAEAILDARNVFDFQTRTSGEEGSLRVNAQGPMVRGGIKVRF